MYLKLQTFCTFNQFFTPVEQKFSYLEMAFGSSSPLQNTEFGTLISELLKSPGIDSKESIPPARKRSTIKPNPHVPYCIYFCLYICTCGIINQWV
jgi:hypothetical protein